MNEQQDAKNWDVLMEQTTTKCEICEKPKTCFCYCHEHHEAICMGGASPKVAVLAGEEK